MRRVLLLLPLPLALAVNAYARWHPKWVEAAFSAGLYPRVAAPVSRLMGAVPLPVVEIGLAALAAFALWSLARRRPFRVIAVLGLLIAAFAGFWGLNYHRLPLHETLGLSLAPASTAGLTALCEKLSSDANAAWTRPTDALLTPANDALNAAATRWPIPAGAYGAPKAALTGPVLTRLSIEGITSPFTLEALVNTGIPALSQPFAACHEAAHLRGFAREEDANLIAYLACRASDNAFYRYSGAVCALMYALDALANADGEAYRAVYASLSEPVQTDLRTHADFWAPLRDAPPARVAGRVNDGYLGAVSGGEQGTRSYGRMVDLLLALARKEGLSCGI